MRGIVPKFAMHREWKAIRSQAQSTGRTDEMFFIYQINK